MVLHTGALKKIRTWKRNWSIQWGRWDCKSKEMSFGIVCHIEVLKLNHEAIVSSLRSMVVSFGALMRGDSRASETRARVKITPHGVTLTPANVSLSRGAARGDIFARHLAAHQRIWN